MAVGAGGFSFVDLESHWSSSRRAHFIEGAGFTSVIASHHFKDFTPPAAELSEMFVHCAHGGKVCEQLGVAAGMHTLTHTLPAFASDRHHIQSTEL